MNTSLCCRSVQILGIALLAVGLQACGLVDNAQAESGDKSSIAVIAKDCRRCHRDDQSLARMADAELTNMLIAMAAGDMEHPTPLPELTVRQVEDLIRALKSE